MRGSSQAGSNVRTKPQAAVPVLVSLLALIAIRASAVAHDTPHPTPTPHSVTITPSRPVRAPIVRSTPIPPGANLPMPSIEPYHEHLVGVTIDGYRFLMHPGPCAFRVEAAIQAHQDILTGDKSCDAQIRQARAIQRQKEAEDPAYANEPRITPAPTPNAREENQAH